MKTITFYLVLIPFVLLSCASEQKESKNKSEKSTEDQSEHDHETKAEVLRLDDGKRWKVNDETTLGVAKMTARTDAFDVSASEEDYHTLFDSLDADFRYIFKMCTTEGVAHDQLHILLFPLRGMFNRLKSPEESIRNEAFENIKMQLGKYPEYFESK